MVALVNHQHRQPLSQAWGGGTLSSSDGQRFPVGVPSRQARPLPRYVAYREEGVTFYTWTSDQWPQYGTKVTPVTARDAPYVLDEVLDNETELRITEHTTDTSGYTEMVLGMFALLGLQFAPRIRDLPDQRLYRLPGLEIPPAVAPLGKGTINTSLILDHWDELLRLAGSLKLGWVTASLLLTKLQTVPRKKELARALQEYGRVVKTLFIPRYVVSPEEQHRLKQGRVVARAAAVPVLRQLGPAAQGAGRGAGHAGAGLDAGDQRGDCAVREEDVAHLSPARHEHINPHGKHRFNLEQELGRQGLRPLRRPPVAKRQTNPVPHSHQP